MDLGLAFKRLRLEKFPNKEKSQGQVAKQAGISQTFLSQIETGDKIPSIKVIKSLCKVYDVPEVVLSWLATEKIDVKKNKHHLYDSLKPVMDSLVNSLITNKPIK